MIDSTSAAIYKRKSLQLRFFLHCIAIVILVVLVIGTDLLLKLGEVLCEHKQSNKDHKKYLLYTVLLTLKNA